MLKMINSFVLWNMNIYIDILMRVGGSYQKMDDLYGFEHSQEEVDGKMIWIYPSNIHWHCRAGRPLEDILTPSYCKM